MGDMVDVLPIWGAGWQISTGAKLLAQPNCLTDQQTVSLAMGSLICPSGHWLLSSCIHGDVIDDTSPGKEPVDRCEKTH